MSNPVRLTTLYATDEDLAIRCNSDLDVLTPASNLLAYAADGVFGAGDRWTLTSATVDFAAQGVAAGNTLLITKPSTLVAPSGTPLAVESVSGSSVTLRRLGLAANVGQPPGPIAGATGVTFKVETLAPQIEQASDEINRRFGIDPASTTRAPSAIYDLRELQEATMLLVLIRQYTAVNRTKDGVYTPKLRDLAADRDAAFGRLQLRWGATPDPVSVPSVFGMQIDR